MLVTHILSPTSFQRNWGLQFFCPLKILWYKPGEFSAFSGSPSKLWLIHQLSIVQNCVPPFSSPILPTPLWVQAFLNNPFTVALVGFLEESKIKRMCSICHSLFIHPFSSSKVMLTTLSHCHLLVTLHFSFNFVSVWWGFRRGAGLNPIFFNPPCLTWSSPIICLE